jgi:uncharacterized protein
MAAKFEISKDHAGKYRFHLKAPNGEIIAASHGYETKANAEKGIEAIKTHGPPPRSKTTAKLDRTAGWAQSRRPRARAYSSYPLGLGRSDGSFPDSFSCDPSGSALH